MFKKEIKIGVKSATTTIYDNKSEVWGEIAVQSRYTKKVVKRKSNTRLKGRIQL